MKQILHLKKVFLFAFVFSFVFKTIETKAQTSNFPTQEQVNAKLAQLALQNYQTGLGTYNPTNKGVMSTGPEQNCNSAIDVCAQTYTQTTSYTGHGTVQEVSASSCLLGQETNSVWYIFTAQTTGTFGFTLNTTKDYDWALYDLTAIGGCAFIPAATPIRCNFSATYGNTGLTFGTTSAELPALSVNAAGSPLMNGITSMTAGNSYALIIDNWSADATGYALTFTGSASIFDNVLPTLSSSTYNCNKTLNINFSEQIKCSSIDKTDFTVTGPSAVSVVAASGNSCSTSNITSSATLTITQPTVTGLYTIHIQNGTDAAETTSFGNTLKDKCDNLMSTAQTLTFNYLAPLTLTPSPTSICTSGAAVTLTATGALPTTGVYTLSPLGSTTTANGSGTGTFTVNPVSTTDYYVTSTYAGCTQTASANVAYTNNIVASINPINTTICGGTTLLTASATQNGIPCTGCTFLWSNAATGNTITVGPGTYTAVATSLGCPSNTASATISTVSVGASSTCNIYYVTNTGGGTGLTKDSPTDLVTAIALSACTNSVIKMAVGNYSITDKINVNSYLTIEGGYNSTFTTKTSNMASGSATTIQRSSAPDGGTGIIVTTFNIPAASTGFRLQDLRIEMPNETVGSQLNNYGIYLGAGCSSYDIVRCYIDAGKGAD